MDIRSPFFAVLAGLAALLALPSTALACSCVQQSVSEQARRSPVIFVGRAVRTERLGGYERATTFRVSETLKGSRAATRRVLHWQNDGGNCGMDFRRGQRLLVVTYREAGRLHTNSCTMPQGSVEDFRAVLKRH